MEYIVLDIYGSRVFRGKEMDFDIRQLAAIHIDEELHTVSSFYRLDDKDSRTAKQIIYLLEVSDEIITDTQSIWEEFKQWLPENVVFIVWGSEIKRIIQWYNKIFRKKPIRARFVDLQMLKEAMLSMYSNQKSMSDVITVMGLTCMKSRMISALYCVQCMLRLYRKLWKEGRKFLQQHEWEELLLRGDFSKLRQMDFFLEKNIKSVQAECRSMIKNFCQEQGYGLHIKGTIYEIDANQAVWRFDLMKGGKDLAYVPRKYARIPHYDMQIEVRVQSMVKLLPEIFHRITHTEERLKFGVGSAAVEEVLERMCGLQEAGVLAH